jgi:hypothetical protein
MSEHSVVLTAAAYASAGMAEKDFDALERGRDRGEHHDVGGAVLRKGADGALGIYRSDGATTNVGPLLGAALAVIAAPLGISFLQSVEITQDVWARVATMVGDFWQNIPQEMLHTMTNLVESSPAGLVIVAIDRTREDIEARLPQATATIATFSTAKDLGADITAAIDDANAAR